MLVNPEDLRTCPAEVSGHERASIWQNVRPDHYKLYEEWWSRCKRHKCAWRPWGLGAKPRPTLARTSAESIVLRATPSKKTTCGERRESTSAIGLSCYPTIFLILVGILPLALIVVDSFGQWNEKTGYFYGWVSLQGYTALNTPFAFMHFAEYY